MSIKKLDRKIIDSAKILNCGNKKNKVIVKIKPRMIWYLGYIF